MNFESTREILADSLKTKEYSCKSFDCKSIHLQYQHSDLEQIKETQSTTLLCLKQPITGQR